MGKRLSRFIVVVLTLFLVLGNTLSTTVSAKEEMSTKKVNKIKIKNKMIDDYDLIDMYSNGKLKTCSYKISVPDGTLVVYIFDRATFKVEITDKTGKTVKTVKSMYEKKPQASNMLQKNVVDIGVSLKKGVYTLKISSTSKKKLDGCVNLEMYAENPSTAATDIWKMPDIAVTAGKTYNFKFTIDKNAEPEDDYYCFVVYADVTPYDIDDPSRIQQQCSILDSSGNVVSLEPINKNNEHIATLVPGTYTLQITPETTGILDPTVTYYFED
jgi:hypothetical protein